MNKVEELSILRRFQSNYSLFPEGEIEPTEQPDFIINGCKKIGIEITQIFQDQENPKGSLIRKIETYQRHLLEDTVEALKDIGARFCLIDIGISKQNFSTSLKPKILARICTTEIQNNIPETANFENLTLNINNEGQLPRLIDHVTVWFSSSLSDFEYVESSGGVGMVLTNEKLQFILKKKEDQIKAYKKCDEYWLIIKEGSSMADYFPVIDINKSNVQTSFDKIFLFRQSGSEIIKLN